MASEGTYEQYSWDCIRKIPWLTKSSHFSVGLNLWKLDDYTLHLWDNVLLVTTNTRFAPHASKLITHVLFSYYSVLIFLGAEQTVFYYHVSINNMSVDYHISLSVVPGKTIDMDVPRYAWVRHWWTTCVPHSRLSSSRPPAPRRVPIDLSLDSCIGEPFSSGCVHVTTRQWRTVCGRREGQAPFVLLLMVLLKGKSHF